MTFLKEVGEVLTAFGVPEYFIRPYLVSMVCFSSSLMVVILFLLKETVTRVKSNDSVCVAENVEKLGLVAESRDTKNYGQNDTSETFIFRFSKGGNSKNFFFNWI